MRTKAISISIAEPCNQNWDLMGNRNAERFCESCQKCVVDFSKISNAEIVKILATSKNEICGRLTNTQLAQLNHYLIAVPTNNNWLKYLGVLAIGTSLFFGGAKAENLKEPLPLSHSPIKNTSTFKTIVPKKIYGYVFDEDNKPVSGVRVVVLNTKLFAQTDNNGRYEIVLSKNSNLSKHTIKVESLRFEGSTRVNFSTSKQADLHLKAVYMIMGKIAMTSEN